MYVYTYMCPKRYLCLKKRHEMGIWFTSPPRPPGCWWSILTLGSSCAVRANVRRARSEYNPGPWKVLGRSLRWLFSFTCFEEFIPLGFFWEIFDKLTCWEPGWQMKSSHCQTFRMGSSVHPFWWGGTNKRVIGRSHWVEMERLLVLSHNNPPSSTERIQHCFSRVF